MNFRVPPPQRRYLVVLDGKFLPDDWLDEGDIMILVDQGDGTYRKATGEDLREIDHHFPGRFGGWHLTRLADDAK